MPIMTWTSSYTEPVHLTAVPLTTLRRRTSVPRSFVTALFAATAATAVAAARGA
jgi:hypothetical protein